MSAPGALGPARRLPSPSELERQGGALLVCRAVARALLLLLCVTACEAGPAARDGQSPQVPAAGEALAPAAPAAPVPSPPPQLRAPMGAAAPGMAAGEPRRPSAAPGEACADAQDCLSGLCLREGGRGLAGRCSRHCGESADCPPGWACRAVVPGGAARICVAAGPP